MVISMECENDAVGNCVVYDRGIGRIWVNVKHVVYEGQIRRG